MSLQHVCLAMRHVLKKLETDENRTLCVRIDVFTSWRERRLLKSGHRLVIYYEGQCLCAF